MVNGRGTDAVSRSSSQSSRRPLACESMALRSRLRSVTVLLCTSTSATREQDLPRSLFPLRSTLVTLILCSVVKALGHVKVVRFEFRVERRGASEARGAPPYHPSGQD